MFFDYFAKVGFQNFEILTTSPNENFFILSTFVCMPAAPLAFIVMLASRPSCTACAECTARRIRDEVELKQTDRNSKF